MKPNKPTRRYYRPQANLLGHLAQGWRLVRVVDAGTGYVITKDGDEKSVHPTVVSSSRRNGFLDDRLRLTALGRTTFYEWHAWRASLDSQGWRKPRRSKRF